MLKESNEEGIRSDQLAETLGVPKRRVYDVIAILRALNQVTTKRRFNGTTVTWIDKTKDFVAVTEYEDIKQQFAEEKASRKTLQIQLAETKEQLRVAKSKIRTDTQAVEASGKTEFDTRTLTVRATSSRGFKKVADSGVEVVIETHESGMVVDPTEIESDENRSLIKSLQRL